MCDLLSSALLWSESYAQIQWVDGLVTYQIGSVSFINSLENDSHFRAYEGSMSKLPKLAAIYDEDV